MANSIQLAKKFLAILAAVYKADSKTSMLDAMTQNIEFAAANTVNVLKMTLVGLGNYSRTSGYPSGDITAEWVPMVLAAERGRGFTLDRMDNEETLGVVLGSLIREWMRTHVAPEVDAYRISKYATGAGSIATPATLADGAAVLAAFDAAMLKMTEDEVPEEGRKLFITSSINAKLRSAVTRALENQNVVDRRIKMLDNVEIIDVPQTRMYTQITLDAGATGAAGGYIKTPVTGKDINFLLMHPSAVVQPTKLNNVKYFAPEVNQISDGHLWQYRLYHDAFVMENHELGIYLHNKA